MASNFRCRGCGACCLTHGESEYVFVTTDEVRRMAAYLSIEEAKFRKRYLVRVGNRSSLRSTGLACIFLRKKRCAVQGAKPDQCATWPWWEENLEGGHFTEDTLFCPGIQALRRSAKREGRQAASLAPKAKGKVTA